MPTLNIGGQSVQVGDEFLKLSPEQQDATVDEIAGHLNAKPVNAGITGSMVSGIPIMGPLMEKGAAAAGAGIQAITGKDLQGNPAAPNFADRYAQNLEQQKLAQQQYAAENPGKDLAGRLIGGTIATAPAMAAAPAAFGLSGPLAQRVVTSGLSGAGISGADAAIRGEDPQNAALFGGGVGMALPVGGAFGQTIGKAFSSAIAPLYASGREAAANRVVSEFAKGGPTHMAPSPLAGSEPTAAQASGNPGLANLERQLRNRPEPEISGQFTARDQSNAANREAAYNGLSGDQLSLEALRQRRADTRDTNLAAAFNSPSEANVRGVVRTIDNILKSPEGQRNAVQSALGDIRGKLVLPNPLTDRIAAAKEALKSANPNSNQMEAFKQARNLLNKANRQEIDEKELTSGLKKLADSQKIVSALDDAHKIIKGGPTKLETDPEQLYGIRKAAGDIMKFNMSPQKLASSQLRDIQLLLDKAIEKAAPGFKSYLKDYAAQSRPIDVQELLQKANARDVKGNINLGNLNRTINNIENMRNFKAGANQAKSLSDAELNQLKAIRDDLRMSENSNLGRATGSNTVQNALGQGALTNILAKQAAGTGVGALAGYGYDLSQGHSLPNVGTALGLGIGSRVLGSRVARGQNEILGRIGAKMLDPQSAELALLAHALKGSKAAARAQMLGILSRIPMLSENGRQ